MQSVSSECQPRRYIGALLSTLPAAVLTTAMMAFAVGWAPGAQAAQDAVICPADRINSNGNICTASDVQLAAAAVGAGSEGGVCTPGEQIQVAVAGTVALRKGDRYDIGIWVSTDGKPIELRGGSNGAPDEGGAQSCEVLPLPYMPISISGGLSPVIDSFDNPAAIQDCYDTSANNNGDESTGFLLTEPRDNVVGGLVDVNADGVIDASDTVPVGSLVSVVGAWVYSGHLDLNGDGVSDANDDGMWSGRNVQDGVVDYNNNGVYGEAAVSPAGDTAAQEFNDLLTLTCQAGPSAAGGLLLDSLVTWNVPSDAANVCDPLNPDTYAAPNNQGDPVFNSSKCSVSSSEIAIQIVGKVTIIKEAPADPSLDFNFEYTNDMKANVDTDGNAGNDISVTSPFTLKDSESAVIFGVIGTRQVDGGAFIPANIVVSETNLPAGWELSDIQCTGDDTTPVVVDTVAGTATIQLSYNAADYTQSQDDVTCTFVNAEAPATLTVVKNTNGGNGSFNYIWGSTNNPASGFSLNTVSGTASTDIVITNGLGDTDYQITETLTAGQIAAGWRIESVQCLDSNDNPVGTPPNNTGTAASVGGMTINPGDHVTCTYVNNAAAQVTVTKVAQGGDDTFPFVTDLPGGNFNLVTSGGGANTGPLVVPVADSSTGRVVNILEDLTGLPNWNLANIACSGITEQVVANQVSFTLQPGNVVNCTFTNVADGNVTIIKNTIGGDANFQFTTDVPGATSPFNIQTSNNTGSVSIATPPPGTYTVSEIVPTDWDLTDMSCNDNDSGPIDADTIQLNVQAGENITCTFTNTQRGVIVIAKETDPVGSDTFGFTSTSGTATPIPASFNVDAGSQVVFNNGSVGLLPGTYTVTEDDPTPGFDLTALNCIESFVVGPNVSTTDVGTRTATINLDPGELVTCTYTNSQRANLTIQKVVSADGPAVNDFDFTSTTLPDASFQLLNVTAGVPVSTTYNNLVPGNYDVAEDVATALANGWALVGSSCSDGSTVDNIQLAPGEDVTCTFTNSPLGSATIIKNTVGGDDTFDYVGTAPFDGLQLTTVAGTAQQDYGFQLDPANNPYGIQEDPLPVGWSLTGLGCVEDGTQDSTTDLVNRSATINAQFGEQITCTFTNTLDGTITIRKETLPDGVDQTFSYTGDLAGSIRDFSAFGEEIVDSLQPGTYSSTETVPAGWQITGISCDDSQAPNSTFTFTNSITPGGTDAYEAGDDTVNVTLAAGENIICSFENTQEGSVTINKTVVGAGGQFNFASASLGGFSLTPVDNGTAGQAFPNLLPNTYMVAETPVPAGYQLTNIVCLGATNSTITIGGNGVFDPGDTGVSIDLAPGEHISCNFTNTESGSITVEKQTLPDGSAVDFTFTGDAAGTIQDNGTITVGDLLPGTYSSTETVTAGWDLTDITCSDGDSTGDTNTATATFNVAAGEDVTCTFTNTQRGTITLVKNLPNDNGGNETEADFQAYIDGSPVAWGTPIEYVPGTYTASEDTLPGYTASAWSGDCDAGGVINLGPGQNLTCQITNDDIAPTLTLTKVVNNNFNGTLGPNDFAITVGGVGVTSGATLDYDANVALALNETVQPGYQFVSITGDAKCPAVLGGTVTLDEGENVSCTITNQDIAPDVNLTKTVNGPAVLEADGTYTVVYTITVNNNSSGIGMYDLVDTFSPGAGITFNSASLQYVAGTENDQSGTIAPTLTSGGTWVTDEGIGIGLNESWTVTANFTVDPVSVDGSRTCDPGNPVINTGFYNAVSGVVDESNTDDNDTCTGLPDPDINLAKTVNGPAVLEGNGTYTVVYTVTVSNGGQGPGFYDLTDTFSPAAGVTLNSATLAYVAGSENSQTGALASPPLANGGTWVTGEALAAARDESWTVTANFTVDPAVLDPAARACDPGNPVINTGFYNAVSGVDNESNVDDNDTCTDIPTPALNLAKTVNGPATLEGNGTYTVVYTVTVTNGGQGPGVYDLTDTFSPANGVTFNSATLAYVPGSENSQTGTLASPPLANGGTWVTGEELAGGQNESWTITANFTVDPATLNPNQAACDPGNPVINTGFYNAVSGIDSESNVDDNDTCTGVPTPALNLAKTVNGAATLELNGTYTVVYTVTATNGGQGAGVYDLTDTFSPPAQVTFNSATLAYVPGSENSQTGALAPAPLANGGTWVSGETLAAGQNESWTITANFSVDQDAIDPADRLCLPSNPVIYKGFYNAVSGVVNEANTDDNDTCIIIPVPTTPEKERIEIPVPVDNKWALALLTLLMLSMGLYFGPRVIRRR